MMVMVENSKLGCRVDTLRFTGGHGEFMEFFLFLEALEMLI